MTNKILFLLLITTSTFSIAQTKEEIEAKDFFWGSNDAYKDATAIPEKWKNESAVVIYKNENYDFHKYGKNVTYKSSIRKRIKLLDKAAVEEFSEFKFTKRFRSEKGRYSWRAKGDNIVAIKIIKPDGSETEIDITKDAVEVDGETKVAISNLEVGDVIDYYFYKIEPFKTTFAFGFDPVETSLGEEYPIMDFKLFFETENDFFINFNSFNGAPELKNIPTEKKNLRRYSLEASDIDKNDFPRWTYPLVELPSYKFQVYFARSGTFESRAIAFLPEKEDIIKTSVTKEEVLELYDDRFKPSGDIGDIKDFYKGRTFKNDTEKITEAYYYMRHYYLTRFIEAFIIKDAGIMSYPFEYYKNSTVFIQNQKQFIRHFTALLKRHKIDYDIVVAKKRYDGTIDELLIERNVNVLLKINTETTLYAEFFGPHTNINEYSPLLEGTEVYLLSAERNKIDVVNKGTLPQSTYTDNETKKDITFTLDADFSGFSIGCVNSYKGFEKQDAQYYRLLFSDYVTEDYIKYGTKSFFNLIRNKTSRAKIKNEFEALVEKLKEKQEKRLKEGIEKEFAIDAIDDYEYKINTTGRYSLDSYFTYTEHFKIKNALIKKAGPNYIIEIGKLVTGQIDLTEKERERREDIQMPYARSYNYNITFNIPEGYTVVGIDKLIKHVDNSTGAFISSAEIEGNTLVINTSKQYKHNFEPNSNWDLMVEFLDEAHQFTNEKVLLRKE